MFKNSKQEKQNKLFLFNIFALIVFRAFINIFTIAFMLIYFDFKNRIIIEIDVLKFAIAIFFLACALYAKQQLNNIVFYYILF